MLHFNPQRNKPCVLFLSSFSCVFFLCFFTSLVPSVFWLILNPLKSPYQLFKIAFLYFSRPFIVKRIPHTNLLLIVVNTLHQSCYRPLSAQVKKVEYNETILSCNKLYLNSLPRRRLAGCYNEHPEVSDFPKWFLVMGSFSYPKCFCLPKLLVIFNHFHGS